MPSRTSVKPTWTFAAGLKIVDAFATNPAAALFSLPEVHLWKDPAFAPTPLSVAADFAAVEADYFGYEPAVLTPLGLISAMDKGWAMYGSKLFVFDAGPPLTPNTIRGYWVENAAGVILFEKFAAGQEVSFAAAGDWLDLSVIFPVAYTPFQVIPG